MSFLFGRGVGVRPRNRVDRQDGGNAGSEAISSSMLLEIHHSGRRAGCAIVAKAMDGDALDGRWEMGDGRRSSENQTADAMAAFWQLFLVAAVSPTNLFPYLGAQNCLQQFSRIVEAQGPRYLFVKCGSKNNICFD